MVAELLYLECQTRPDLCDPDYFLGCVDAYKSFPSVGGATPTAWSVANCVWVLYAVQARYLSAANQLALEVVAARAEMWAKQSRPSARFLVTLGLERSEDILRLHACVTAKAGLGSCQRHGLLAAIRVWLAVGTALRDRTDRLRRAMDAFW